MVALMLNHVSRRPRDVGSMMLVDPRVLELMLQADENPSVDFKSEWYKLDQPPGEGFDRQQGEMIKDFLSLANGNAATAAATSYLIIGADDKLPRDGARKLHDVGDVDVAKLRGKVMRTINSACNPPIGELEVAVVGIRDTRLLVFMIPASPDLHETTRPLKTAKPCFSQHVTFVRNIEETAVASAAEREAIRLLKRHHFRESRKVAPVPFASGLGAVLGLIALTVNRNDILGGAGVRVVAAFVASATGALVGGSLGWAYRQLADINRDAARGPRWLQGVVLGITALAVLGYVSWLVVRVAQ